MCRPPDLTPSVEGFPAGDGFDFAAEGEDWNNDGNLDSVEFDAAASDLGASSILGKRGLSDEERLAEALSRNAKSQRTAVTSAFDSAAATFVARMEQSMLQDLQKQQQQRQDSLLLKKALIEQRVKLQQLQQLQLLKQLQQAKAAEASILPEQQQLLLAQQLLAQQSQNKLLNVGAPAPHLATDPAWAAVMKQQQQQNSASLLGAATRLSAQNKIQQLMQAGAGPAPVIAGAKPLPVIHPKPILGAAAPAVELNPAAAAAAMFGMGSLGQRSGGLVIGEEKKQKRMMSNRASAKRSRQRRQARLEELDKTTAQLQEENASMCSRLERAQQEIQSLEVKNRSLVGEVNRLRQILGLEAHETKGKAEPEQTVSGASRLQSCLDSEDCYPCAADVVVVKDEEMHEDDEDDHEDAAEDEAEAEAEAEACAGLEDAGLEWLGSLPLSPSAVKPDSPFNSLMTNEEGTGLALDQLLGQGDAFSELLACLDA